MNRLHVRLEDFKYVSGLGIKTDCEIYFQRAIR